jgi:DNA mismatch repair protein Mlh1 C-terminus
MLVLHAVFLNNCFGVEISASGHLCALPDLLRGVLPNAQRLPAFLAQLSRCLCWPKAQHYATIAEVKVYRADALAVFDERPKGLL